MRRLSAWLTAAVAAAGTATGVTTTAAAARPESLSVAAFDTQIQESGVVPEVFASLDPSVSFYASYVANTGADELLVPGSSLSINESQLPFEFSIEGVGNVTGINALTRYIIFLIDADAPSRNSPTERSLRQYLQGNFTLSSTKSSVLPTANLLVVTREDNDPFTPFQQPRPLPHTGTHRLVYALYVQPDAFNSANFDAAGMNNTLANWDISAWEKQLGLSPPIGATFFLIDTEANGGSGTSVTQASGAGRLSSAVPVLASMMAVLLVCQLA